MGTMMALQAHVRGGPGQLIVEQAPASAAAPGEALVAVHPAAITFAELTWDLSWTTWDGRQLAALTAWQAPVDYAAVEPGERALALDGAGGLTYASARGRQCYPPQCPGPRSPPPWPTLRCRPGRNLGVGSPRCSGWVRPAP